VLYPTPARPIAAFSAIALDLATGKSVMLLGDSNLMNLFDESLTGHSRAIAAQ
jgi:hypothetical protein